MGGVAWPSRWEQIVVDAEDPARLARWWAEALGYRSCTRSPTRSRSGGTPDEMPGLLFTPGAGGKTVKNRLHIDLRPDDQEAEVERLVDMGARPVDIGQHDVGWVVLADPEGNEFCVLSQGSERSRSVAELADQGPGSRAAAALTRSADCRVVFAPSAVASVDVVMCETVPLISRRRGDTSPTLRAISSVVADCSSTAAAMVRCRRRSA